MSKISYPVSFKSDRKRHQLHSLRIDTILSVSLTYRQLNWLFLWTGSGLPQWTVKTEPKLLTAQYKHLRAREQQETRAMAQSPFVELKWKCISAPFSLILLYQALIQLHTDRRYAMHIFIWFPHYVLNPKKQAHAPTMKVVRQCFWMEIVLQVQSTFPNTKKSKYKRKRYFII